MQDRKPRMVFISPDAAVSTNDSTRIYNMTCQSGGEVEVYIEPIMPKPQLLIFGSSHIAMALAKLADAMEYRVQAVMSTIDTSLFPEAAQVHTTESFNTAELSATPYVIVCTQGEGDAVAMEQALNLNAPYLAFVASRKKANATYRELKNRGFEFSQMANIKTPAGLDLGAKTPYEVAVSILAEIIQDFRQPKENDEEGQTMKPMPKVEMKNEDYYINPVCDIPVQKSSAKHVLEHAGEKVYFCCDGCKVSFEKEPEKYMAKV